jgi:hypothetical protein
MASSDAAGRIRARVTRLHGDDGAFDREFWGSVGPEARLAALWQMVEEWADWRGIDRDELRLQRSAGRAERRRR